MNKQKHRLAPCLVCVNPDLNIIDGSSIWAQTICLVLAETGLFDVHMIAKSTPERDTLFLPLLKHPRITIIDGTDKRYWGSEKFRRLNLLQMTAVAKRLDDEFHYTLIVVRGYEIARQFLNHKEMLHRSWLYLTDIKQKIDLISKEDRRILRSFACNAQRILCQSEGFLELWSHIEPQFDESRYTLYSPVVPDLPELIVPLEKRPRSVIYAGKFKNDWMTLEMVKNWPGIHKDVPEAKLIMIGDKFHQEKTPPNYPEQMREALETTAGVIWKGAMSREAVQREIEMAVLGLSWRSEEMNETLEYSTKILEYGRAGCPAILNRNKVHEQILGKDYPLFANSEKEFHDAVVAGLTDPEIANDAARRLSDVAELHTFSHRVETLRTMLTKDLALRETNQKIISSSYHLSAPYRVLVAGHDFKFFNNLKNKLEKTGKYNFLFDEWSEHNKHDEEKSRYLLEQADIIFCEWCLGNLVWYSQNKLPHQRLVARLHLQEHALEYIYRAEYNNIDHISFVGEHIRSEVLKKIPFPHKKTSVISNLIDHQAFLNTKKMGGSDFTLGMIGVVPSRKRLDRALDTLEILLDKNPQYQLRIKGHHPTDYAWLLKRQDEVEYYEQVFKRINHPRLRYSVIFDPPGSDVATWLSLVCFILSPSDFESYHLAIGEGMLTGALPVIWDWQGAKDIWPEESIVSSPQEAAQMIERLRLSSNFEILQNQSRKFMLEKHNCDYMVKQWENHLLG